MRPEFDMVMANVLTSRRKSELCFPNYTVQSGRPVPQAANNKAITKFAVLF
jgi:hypothetical protein